MPALESGKCGVAACKGIETELRRGPDSSPALMAASCERVPLHARLPQPWQAVRRLRYLRLRPAGVRAAIRAFWRWLRQVILQKAMTKALTQVHKPCNSSIMTGCDDCTTCQYQLQTQQACSASNLQILENSDTLTGDNSSQNVRMTPLPLICCMRLWTSCRLSSGACVAISSAAMLVM